MTVGASDRAVLALANPKSSTFTAILSDKGAAESPIAGFAAGRALKDDVRWFEIAVDDALGVCRFYGFANLQRDRDGFSDRQGPASDATGQRFAFYELEHQERRLARILETVNRRNARMVQSGEYARLTFEARQAIRIRREARGQNLDRDFATEFEVFCAIDLSHAARAKLRQNLILPQPPAPQMVCHGSRSGKRPFYARRARPAAALARRAGQKDKLLRQDLRLHAQMNRLRMEHRAGRTAAERELERTQRDLRRMIQALKDGFRGHVTLKIEWNATQEGKADPAGPARALGANRLPLLHPALADLCRRNRAGWPEALERPETRNEAAEAIRGIRGHGSAPAPGVPDSRSMEPRAYGHGCSGPGRLCRSPRRRRRNRWSCYRAGHGLTPVGVAAGRTWVAALEFPGSGGQSI